ncbi:MAG: A/G-specific adenine glycosylase [Chloroflexi bacterium]|nr:A/G-specific adenine glycosylase [Chloroflexota bacterium]
MTPAAALSPQRLGRIRSRLLDWYEQQGADFPWRDARNPYWALVAAVCSQQTQMSRVLPLWRRWIEAFPTLEALAVADRAEVLRVWANAGYPRRALHLREAARRCLEEHEGRLPQDEQALLALPGVGPFTAAIVRCFGFGEDAAALDTNVARVVGRLLHGDLQPVRETPAAALREGARLLRRPGTAARWNPALMDYGARVCLPRPRCAACVVASWCVARPRFAAGERAEPLRAQPPFEGSDRQWRGRILAALREAPRSLPEERLIAELAESAGPRSPSPGRLRALLDELSDEGFVWRRGGRCGLGAPPAGEATGADGADSASLPAASDRRSDDG